MLILIAQIAASSTIHGFDSDFANKKESKDKISRNICVTIISLQK